MQKTILGLSIVALLSVFPQVAQASNTSVSVNTEYNSSIHSTTTSNNGSSDVDIIIDSNGEHIEHHSKDGSPVNLETKDGKNKVTINNNGGNKPSPTTNPTTKPTQSPTSIPTSSPTAQPTASASATITIEGDVLGTKITAKEDTLFEYITHAFSTFFEKFF